MGSYVFFYAEKHVKINMTYKIYGNISDLRVFNHFEVKELSMKIDRLIGILTVLLQKEKVTAPYLADKFEVSRRTINRDIEDLCKAGIPISTLQGSNGGISIADGYHIDKTFFTEDELKSIFAGLLSLDSVAQDKKYQSLIDKFFPEKVAADSHIIINLASFYKDTLAPKIAELHNAIEERKVIEFTYYNANGERHIVLDPYLITFQWSSWYVFGFDHDKRKFRLYKLNRLCSLQATCHSFAVQDIPFEQLDFNQWFTDDIHIVAIFDADVKYRLIEEYGHNFYTELPDGRLRFEYKFTNKEYFLGWLLGFGEKVELIEPSELREELKIRLENTIKKYLE